MSTKIFTLGLMLSVLITATGFVAAQEVKKDVVFNKIKIVVPEGDSFKEVDAIVTFREETFDIVYGKTSETMTMNYSDIAAAEYSYSKSPRWKSGLGLGATAIIFPPILLVAIPLGFTKHRRHWLTVKTEDQFAVLKLSKSNRKMIIPTLETRAGLTVSAVGEDK